MSRLTPLTTLTILIAISLLAQAANPVPFVNQPLGACQCSSREQRLHAYGEWNGSARSTTFVSSSVLKATMGAPDVANPGTGKVTVSSGGPDSNPAYLWIATPASTLSFSGGPVFKAPGPGQLLAADLNGDQKF